MTVLILQRILGYKENQSEKIKVESFYVPLWLQVAFYGFKNQILSDIALDDISLSYGICNVSVYPEPTLVPTPPPELPSK